MLRIAKDYGLGVWKTKYPVNANQTITAGSVVKISSGKLSAAATGDGENNVIMGVALEAITTSGSVTGADAIHIDENPFTLHEIPYTGSSKTSLEAADIGKIYDLGANNYTLNLDDTTNGCLQVIDFDNDKEVAYVRIVKRAIFG